MLWSMQDQGAAERMLRQCSRPLGSFLRRRNSLCPVKELVGWQGLRGETTLSSKKGLVMRAKNYRRNCLKAHRHHLCGKVQVLLIAYVCIGLVALAQLVTATDACSFRWQVTATLAPVLSDQDETIEETVVRSTAVKSDKIFSDAARIRLSWSITRKLGISGYFESDPRVTTQAYGMGIVPTVDVDPIFVNDTCGASDWCKSIQPTVADNPEDGWEFIFNLNQALMYSPVMLTTSTAWQEMSGRIDICTSRVVLRTPLLELLDISDENPTIPLRETRGVADRDLVTWAGDSNSHLPSHITAANIWTDLKIHFVPGFSWLAFLTCYRRTLSGIKYLFYEVSTNTFQERGQQSFTALDLASLYPLSTPRSNYEYEWDLSHDVIDAYEEVDNEDTYLDTMITGELSNNAGPCVRIQGYWEPQVWSLGTMFVSPTTWGLAYRQVGHINLLDDNIMEDWTMLAPLCGHVVASSQLDPVDRSSACSFFFVPFSANLTVTYKGEAYDYEDFENLTMPTLFAGVGTEDACTTEGTSDDAGFTLQEVKDDAGLTLAGFLGSNTEAIMVDVRTVQPNALGAAVILLNCTDSDGNISQRLVSYVNTSWLATYTFPSRFEPIPFLSTSRGEHLFPLAENAKPLADTVELQLRGIEVLPRVSRQLYAYGNTLLMSQNSGHTFWKIAQASSSMFDGMMDLGENDTDTFSFENDPIKKLTASSDGWYAVLTDNARIWLGKSGSDTIYLVNTNLTATLKITPPFDIFFDEAYDLRVVGLEVIGVEGMKRQVSASTRVSLDRVKDISDYYDTSSSTCFLEDLLFVSSHDVEYTRSLLHRNGVTDNVSLAQQENGFYNKVPNRIFLDHSDNYTFQVLLQAAVNSDVYITSQAQVLSDLRLGFELSNQELIELSFTRTENALSGIVNYTVMLRDRGSWQIVDNLLKLPADTSTSGLLHAYPGANLLVTSFWVQGLSEGCRSEADPRALVTTTSISEPARIDIYSGCPPHWNLVFDRTASLDGENQGCTEHEEDICVFYDNTFTPRFRLIDSVAGTEQIVDGSYGEITAVGGGLTYDTIEDYDQADWDMKTSTSFSISSSSSTYGLRWLCMAATSPCAGVMPSFPYPPEYYFKLRLVATSNDSYCDFSSTFIVRIHNLPITLQAIIITNALTIGACMIPLLYWYTRKQKRGQHRRLREVQDVSMAQYTKSTLNLSDDGSSSSDESSIGSSGNGESSTGSNRKRRGRKSKSKRKDDGDTSDLEDDEDDMDDNDDDDDEDDDPDEAQEDDDEDLKAIIAKNKTLKRKTAPPRAFAN